MKSMLNRKHFLTFNIKTCKIKKEGRKMKKVILTFILLTNLCIWAQNNVNLDALYKQALNFYYQKKYPEALNLFNQIKGIDPSFRKSQVDRYINVTKTKLGKLGMKETYKIGEGDIKEITVSKEDEFEKLAEYAQKALLETTDYLKEITLKYNISELDMVAPKSTLEMARKAYDNNQFTEAIRLSNKARFQAEQLIQDKIIKEKPPLGEIGERLVTLNLTDADLQQTLKLIYDLTGANIILSRDIKGRVTINVKDIPLKKVLELICEANGLKYIYEDGVIKILTKEEFEKRQEFVKQQSKRVFKIMFGDASSIVKALKETFKDVDIIAEPRTNSIIVNTENSALLSNIQEVITTLDSPVSQVLIEAKIVEVSTSTDNMFAIDWLINSRLIESINATLTGPRFGTNPGFTPGVSSSLPQGGFSFGITNKDVNVLISALSSHGNVKLVQAPKIMCLNGTTAFISVIQNFPYILPEYEATYNPQTGALTGTRQTVTVYEETVGTEFEITPVIQRNRTVFLTTNIYDARFVESRTLNAVAAGLTYRTEIPIISSRETTQSILLYDGQTLVVGGMIQTREEKTETGVPFLRRIPLLGYLFKQPKYLKTNSELILFLTPHIVTSYEEISDLTKPEIKKFEEPIKPGIMDKF
jgi:type II secretory pathway component GspD/PulD (secretin)